MSASRPTALVLSAGGMFGAYQAGVWRAIAGVFDPDIVVGASVGSLNGWRIACRAEPEDLVRHWLELGDMARLRWRIPRHLRDGFLDSAALESEIRRMCEEAQPIRRYGVVLTRLPSMVPTLFEYPEAGWRHLATSCAVPLFLRHHRIGTDYYSDGGLVDPLPLRAALAMGARTVVTVNLLRVRPLPVRALVRGIRLYSGYRLPETERVRVIDISPSTPLGSARDSMLWSREWAASLIARGERDAQAALDRIVECEKRESFGVATLSNSPAAGVVADPLSLGSSHGGSVDDQAEGV